MAVIKRGEVAPPTLPKETVEVEALGGEVVVRGLLLTERLDLEAYMVALAKERRDASEVNGLTAPAPGMSLVMPRLLHMTVLDADGDRLWSEREWEVFGGKHHGQASALFLVAWRLAGFREPKAEANQAEVEKN